MAKLQRYKRQIFEEHYMTENIYGNNAIVYHRTRTSDLINGVYTEGFKPGDGDMYGKGFYSTYDLKSQLGEGMRVTYGDVIVKFQVTIKNFFVFNYEEFVKTPNYKKLKSSKENFISDQIDYFKINYDKKYLGKYKDSKYSSELALNMYENSNLGKVVDGIIFTGSRDGNVLVCYVPKIVIPTSFSLDEGKTFEKVTPKNMEYIKNVWKLKQSGFYSDLDERPPMPEDFGIKNYTINNDGSLDVKGGVYLNDKGLTILPFKFNKVSDFFRCGDNQLESLEGSPQKVGGGFYCYGSQLKSLKGSPKEVGGDFDCSGNKLESLEGSPKKVSGDFYCYDNNLISLEGSPKEVGGDFDCYQNTKQFTKEDVEAVSKVGGDIIV